MDEDFCLHTCFKYHNKSHVFGKINFEVKDSTHWSETEVEVERKG